jgi:DnaJ-class molecular chaperone
VSSLRYRKIKNEQNRLSHRNVAKPPAVRNENRRWRFPASAYPVSHAIRFGSAAYVFARHVGSSLRKMLQALSKRISSPNDPADAHRRQFRPASEGGGVHTIAETDSADPYKTLGVARDASQAAISRAYRKLAKRYHPDLNPGNAESESRFKAISGANGLLSDPEKRSRFDRGEIDSSGQEQARPPPYRDYAAGEPGRRYGRAGPQPAEWGDDDFADVFGTMFRDGRSQTGPRRGADQNYSLTAEFLDAVNGATRRLTLPDGRTLDVKLPAGTGSGDILRLRGQGGDGFQGGAKGDALIEIQVLPHRFFQRDGADIRLVLPVSLTEAALGGPIEIPTPGGAVRMRVPPGSDSGTELRLRGRGVPEHGGRAAGDLYATLRIMLGKPDPALNAFLKHWTPEQADDPRKDMT